MSTTSPVSLADTVARAWPQIEACFSAPELWRSFSARMLALLRRLDDPTADRVDVARRIQALLAEVPAVQSAIQRVTFNARFSLRSPSGRRGEMGLRSPFAKKTPDDRNEPMHEMPVIHAVAAPPVKQRRTLISVLYGTDRVPLPAKGDRPRYADQGGEALSFGIATVSLPDDHRKGVLERPRWYRLEFRENPDKHVVITSLSALSQEAFIAQAQAARQLDGSDDEGLIFVHGYNVDFGESILRTAQFAVDLEFRGVAMAYSWPSKGSLSGYGADANASESSMFRLAEFIALARSELGLKRVHVVAHSMGSRLLARALNQLMVVPPAKPQAELNQIVFAAPDIDPKTFSGFAKVFTQSCRRCTLYASSRDLALTASRWIYRSPRAGDTGGMAWMTHGVDTIDASDVDQSLMGHSYFSDRRTVLADLHEVIEKGTAPPDRYGLREVVVEDTRYWAFKP